MAAAKRVLRYLCSTSGMGLVLGGRSPVVLTGHADASWADDQATQQSSQGYTFGLGSGSVSWRATRSSSILGSSCEAEIYAGAMAAQELRWLTYLLTDLGEPPRSPPVLYVDNKAMLAFLGFTASRLTVAAAVVACRIVGVAAAAAATVVAAAMAVADWQASLAGISRRTLTADNQVCGADYDETYSPVSSYITSRILLGIVAVLDLNQMQLDMKNAFMQSKLDRVLYMYQPDYFDDGTGRVFKLLRSLYGLKQSPLLCQVDEALYFKAIDDGVTCWVLIYVDNLLAASSSPVMLKELKGLLEAAFELREILPVVKYLGLEIVRDRPARKLWLHQQGYANNLRRRFIDEEQGGRVAKTPVSVDAYAELTFDDEEAQEREEEYRQMVGSLQFAATTTRPDIAFAYSKLGSDLTVRSDQHWREVDRCLAYLVDTRDTALEFGGGPESLKLIGYVDANDVGNKQDRTSTGGYVFVYGRAAVSWSSSRINSVTLSSTKSEYVAATDACKEGCRLRFLLAEFKLLDAGKPTILRVDNNSAITVAEGLGLTRNLKHVERRYA
ncbi:unnamed protein product [Closterium sp. NIES-54]